MLLKVLLFAQLFHVVNQVHFSWLDTGVPGLAPTNVLFLLTLPLLAARPDEVPGRGAATSALLWLFAGLTWAFAWAQLRAPGDLVADLTYYKNAAFYPLFYFMYLRCRQDERTTRALVVFLLVVAAIAALEALREGLAYGLSRYSAARRASGPFGTDYRSANRAGVFFAMFMPMFVSLALFLRGRTRWRLAALCGAAVTAAGTLFTYSRQAYVLVPLAAALLLLRRSVLVAIAAAAALATLAPALPDSVFQRVEETSQQNALGEETVDQSTASRLELWAGAMQMLRDHPLGVGLFRFRQEIGNYSRYRGMDAHNFYVLLLAEGSVLSLAPWLLVVWTMFRLAASLRAEAAPGDAEASALARGFTVCTLCMALGGLYGSPNLEGAVMAPYWALAGLLERYAALRRRRAEGGDLPRAKPSLVERFPLAAYLPQPRAAGR